MPTSGANDRSGNEKRSYGHVTCRTELLGKCVSRTYGGGVGGAKVSVNDSEAVRPVIEYPLWFHSRELIGRATGNSEVICPILFSWPILQLRLDA